MSLLTFKVEKISESRNFAKSGKYVVNLSRERTLKVGPIVSTQKVYANITANESFDIKKHPTIEFDTAMITIEPSEYSYTNESGEEKSGKSFWITPKEV
jgi:hypothetical protein